MSERRLTNATPRRRRGRATERPFGTRHVGSWLSLVVVTAFGYSLAALLPSPARAAEPICTESQDSSPLASFTLFEGQATELPLGRRTQAEIDLEFSVAGCRFAHQTRLEAVARLFRKGAAKLDRNSLDIVAYGRGDDAVVTLTVHRQNAEPGRYVGAVVLEPDFRHGQKVRVPVSVTVKYRNMKKLAWCVFPLTILLGSALVLLKGLAAGGGDSFLRSFKWKGLALDSIAAGAGGVAALAAWKSEYLTNETWGSEDPFWDGVDVLLVMVAAYVAAATAVSIPTDAARRRVS